MTCEEKVRSYLPLVDFLAEILGPTVEVVLHDVRNREHSLMAIRNGSLSGRDVGAPMSDFASQILRHAKNDDRNFITNYLGKAGSDGKFLKASTFFIRDEDGEVIGMLGVNMDLSEFSRAHKLLGQMLAVEEIKGGEPLDALGEAASIRDMVADVIDQVLNEYAVDPARLTTEEKKNIVENLNEKGVFLLKGTVADVATRLDVSEQTIYRYLK